MPQSKTVQAKATAVKTVRSAQDQIEDLLCMMESGACAGSFSPVSFGLPATFHTAQELQYWIEGEIVEGKWVEGKEGHLSIKKDGKEIPVKLIPEMLEMIWDYWTRKYDKGICWKPRGGGGSVAAAIIIFLKMVWHQESYADLAGSGEQAQNVYLYVTGFFELCSELIDGEPLKSNTSLLTGVWLACLTASEKSARGKHPPNLIVDEACILPNNFILTSDGFKKIDKLSGSEKLLSGDGHYEDIKNIWTKDVERKAVKIVPLGYSIGFSVTEDHLLFVSEQTPDEHKSGEYVKKYSGKAEPPRWIEAGSVTKGDYLVFPKPKRTRFANYFPLRCYEGKNGKIQVTKKIPLSNEFYRWLGYWLGDGSIDDKISNGEWRIKLTVEIGCDWIDDYIKLTRKLFNRKVNNRSKENDGEAARQLTFSHRGLNEWIKLNLGWKRQERKLPPWIFENASDQHLKNLLRGMIKTDGTRLHSRTAISGLTYTTISPSLANLFCMIIFRLGGVPSFYNTAYFDKRTKKTYSRFVVSCHGNLGVSLACQFFDLRDARKRIFQSSYTDDSNFVYVPIKKIESFKYSGMVYDIEMRREPSFSLPWCLAHNCQKDSTVDTVIEAAINMIFSEAQYSVLALSTFHVAFGWFQDTWDHATEKGWARYKWTIYDCMKRCVDPMDCRQCALTEKVPVLDGVGRVIKYKYTGCNGKARKSQGWLNKKNVVDARKTNTRETFSVEFECNRPTTKGRVYGKEDVDRTFTANTGLVIPKKEYRSSVGIDWGFEAQTAVIPCQRHPDHLAVPAEAFFTSTSTGDIISYLNRLKREIGKFIVYADASHAFNNFDVHNAGFEVVAVPFAKWKKFGIDNVSKHMEMGRLYVSEKCRILHSQMDRYHKNERGEPVKSNDHGPDALMSFLDGKITVVTPDGSKKLSDLVIGDKVLTHKGRFRKVLKTDFRYYSGDEHKVWVDGGSNKHQPMCTTAEHPYFTGRGWVEAQDLNVGDTLFMQARECQGCGTLIEIKNKFCPKCRYQHTNDRWKTPTKREEKERKIKSKRLFDEYNSGIRDRQTNTEKATRRANEKYADGTLLGFKDKEFLCRCLELANTPEKRLRQAKRMRENPPMRNKEIRDKVSIAMKQYCQRPEVKERLRKQGLKNLEFMISNWYPSPNKWTDIELLMMEELVERDLLPVHNKKIGKYFGDFVFEKEKIIIECDGDYWHARREKEKPGYDEKRNKYLSELGWDVIRFSGSEIINDAAKCVQTVAAVLKNHRGEYKFLPTKVTRIEVTKSLKKKIAYHFEVEEDKSYVARGIIHHNCALLHFPYMVEFPSSGNDLQEEAEKEQSGKTETQGGVIVI